MIDKLTFNLMTDLILKEKLLTLNNSLRILISFE